MALRASLSVLALVAAWPCSAYGAEAQARVGVEAIELEVAATCRRVDAAQLQRLLSIEAQQRGRASGARVRVTCEAGSVVTLRVELAGDAATAHERRFAERDVAGEVGARVLSLAVVEQLNDAGREPAPAALPVREPVPAPASALAPPAPATPTPSVRLMAAGSAYGFGFEQALAGGGFSVDFLRLSRLGLRLELGMALGSRDYDLGRARLQLTTMSAQAGYLAVHESWTARALVGYRFGSARIVGEAADAQSREGTVSGACGGPLLSAGLGLRRGSFVAELGAEAGLVSFPLEGTVDGASPIQLDGYWLGLSLNVGVLL